MPEVLGSRATHLISRIGGVGGRALAAGDSLPLGPQGEPRPGQCVDAELPASDQAARIRVLPGPHADRFSADALDVLQASDYTVTNESDRMGFRLAGARLTHTGSADIISDAAPLGVLQVPASGQPVLLMADRQTTGGYPNLATVISADIGLAGQLAPGDRMRFEVCTLHAALTALVKRERVFMAIERGERA